jgi:ParB family transcriptional regulator, chromosome partitioning protein
MIMNKAASGLGAYLGATLPKRESEPVTQITTTRIIPCSLQPRRFFDPVRLDELRESIAAVGIKEPLLLRPAPNQPGYFESVKGGRRSQVAKHLGLETCPAIVRDMSDAEAMQLIALEVLSSEHLTPPDEVDMVLSWAGSELGIAPEEVVRRLYAANNRVNHAGVASAQGGDIDDLLAFFKATGINWASFLKHKVPILNMPEDVLAALRTGRLPYTIATEIAKVKDEDERARLLTLAIAGATRDRIRELVRELKNPGVKQEKTPKQRLAGLSRLWSSASKDRQKKAEELIRQLEQILAE